MRKSSDDFGRVTLKLSILWRVSTASDWEEPSESIKLKSEVLAFKRKSPGVGGSEAFWTHMGSGEADLRSSVCVVETFGFEGLTGKFKRSATHRWLSSKNLGPGFVGVNLLVGLFSAFSDKLRFAVGCLKFPLHTRPYRSCSKSIPPQQSATSSRGSYLNFFKVSSDRNPEEFMFA